MVHNVEAVFSLLKLLTVSGIFFLKYEFHGHYSYFRKYFQLLFAVKEGDL